MVRRDRGSFTANSSAATSAISSLLLISKRMILSALWLCVAFFAALGVALCLHGASYSFAWADEATQDVAAASVAAREKLPEGTYLIRTALSDTLVLDIAGASSAPGANLQLYTSNMTSAQRFTLSYDDAGNAIIKTQAGVIAAAGLPANGVNVCQQKTAEDADKSWILTAHEDGSYTIAWGAEPNFVLDVSGAQEVNGANLQLYRDNGTAAQRFFFMPVQPSVPESSEIAEGLYTIGLSSDENYVFDVKGNSPNDGAEIQLYKDNGTAAQVFRIEVASGNTYSIRCLGSDKALDVTRGNLVAGTLMQQWTLSSSNPNQRFVICQNDDGTYTIYSVATGMVLDVSGGQAKNGARIQTYYPNGAATQKFILKRADERPAEGIYEISPSYTGSVAFDVEGASYASGANVQLYDKNGSLAQKFQVKHAEGVDGVITIQSALSGNYLADTEDNVAVIAGDGTAPNTQWKCSLISGGHRELENLGTGKVLDVKGGGSYSGCNVWTYERNNTSAQCFDFKSAKLVKSGSCFVLTNALGGKAIDVASGSTANGAAVQLYDRNDSDAQKWVFTDVGDGYYTLRRVGSRSGLDATDFGSANGTPLQIWTLSGNTAERFKLIPSGDGWFYLKCATGEVYVTSSHASGQNGTRLCLWEFVGDDTQKFRLNPVTYSEIEIHQDIRSVFDHGPKPAANQKYIVLHDTEGDGRAENTIDWWASNGNLVASHFIVNKDGSIWQCVPLDRIAHHAGYGDAGHNSYYGIWEDGRDDMRGASPIGSWAPDYAMNAWSVGIEMVHASGGYPEAQLEALDKLIAYIDNYYGFESTIIDHKAWRSGNSDTSWQFAGYLANYQRTRTHDGS